MMGFTHVTVSVVSFGVAIFECLYGTYSRFTRPAKSIPSSSRKRVVCLVYIDTWLGGFCHHQKYLQSIGLGQQWW